METTLIQAMDASNSLSELGDAPAQTNIGQKDAKIASRFTLHSARMDLFAAGLLGCSALVPAGNVADSPVFQRLVNEVYACKNAGRSSWQPFSLALDKRFENYTQFALNYPFEATGRRAQIPDGRLEILADLYSKRDFQKLDSFVPGLANTASLIFEHVEPAVATRPLGAGFQQPSDYTGSVLNRIKNLKPSEQSAYKVRKIIDTMAMLTQSNTSLQYRGDFYKKSEDFEDSWGLMRLWLDDHFNKDFHRQYGSGTRVATTHTMREAEFSDLEIFVNSYRSVSNKDTNEVIRSNAQDVQYLKSNKLEFSFEHIWELHSHDEFLMSAEMTRRIYNAQTPEAQAREQLQKHIELAANHIADFQWSNRPDGILLTKASQYAEETAAAVFCFIALLTGSLTQSPDVLQALNEVSTAADAADEPWKGRVEYATASFNQENIKKLRDDSRNQVGNLLRYFVNRDPIIRV